MNFLAKLRKQDDGFTLVELMVVVGIIGLLSAVAVPNFKKYQARAKITEARLQLAALYTAEASFFSDFNMYANCLRYMGFDPSTEAANRYYTIGFNNAANINTDAYTAAQNSGLNNHATNGCPRTLASTANLTYFPAGKGIGSVIASDAITGITTTLGTQASSAQMTFMAAAAGYISADKTATSSTDANARSYLTINENKILQNVANGY